MTNREFHAQCRQTETNTFHRVLNALPHDQFHYQPHAKSQSAARIVSTLIQESGACTDLINTGEFTFGPAPELTPAAQIEAFGKAWDELLRQVETMSEDAWAKPGRFLMNGHVVQEQSVGQFVWFFFFDALHHRGQVSTYIRPMGGRVPSIYGPSGDDPTMRSASQRKME